MNSNVPLDNENFVDEIHENDIVVTNINNKKINILLVIISIFLLLLAALFLLYKKGIIVFNNTYHISNHLFVVYSDSSFGDTVENFDNYDSFDTAYSYSFAVHNNSDKELNYEVTFIDLNYGDVENINKMQVNYSILKNSESIFKGNLSKDEEIVLTSQKIFSGQIDDYEIKLWADDNVLGSLKFKIIVDQ